MSLSRRMKNAALRANLKAAANKNGASNSQFGKAIEEQEDSYLANILGSINKSSFMKKVLYNAIGLTLMAATPNFAGEITGVSGTSVVKDGTTYTINTADANFKGNTAFNAFKQFQLDQGEIANMMVGKHAGTSAPVTGIDNYVEAINFLTSILNNESVNSSYKENISDYLGRAKIYLNNGDLEEANAQLDRTFDYCNGNSVHQALVDAGFTNIPASIDAYATTLTGDITIKGNLNVEGYANATVKNSGAGDIVLKNNALINAGAVSIEANGNIKQAENEADKAITVLNENGEYDNDRQRYNRALQFTTHNGNVALGKYSITASNGEVGVPAESGSVTLGNVNPGKTIWVQAHSGITTGNLTANGTSEGQGVRLENTLYVWNVVSVNNALSYLSDLAFQTPSLESDMNVFQNLMEARSYFNNHKYQEASYYLEEAVYYINQHDFDLNINDFKAKPTGDIKAGDLTAQYVQDNETKFGLIKINNTDDDVIGGKSLPDADRNVILSNVTGGEVSIGAMGAITVDPDSACFLLHRLQRAYQRFDLYQV